MANENRDARRPKGYKPFWEGEEEEVVEEAPAAPAEKPYDWGGLKSRLIGDKFAGEVATEEIEKLKKKKEMGM
jgi:hypothetical protein